ncbi:hypothetical protein EGI20_17975 [Aquitalea sp. S1-19]|nr:hypothetical protein [Aquitalea sp. S1-19]
MFESAEIGHSISKADWKARVPALREALLDAQYDLKQKPDFPVLILIHGFDAAGRGETLNLVNEWLDPRLIHTVAFDAPNDEARAQPWLWRFWRHVPGKGHTAIFDRSWYGRVLVERVEGFCGPEHWMRAYYEINDFEHQLVADGAIVLKFWLATSAEEQLARFQAREETGFKRFKITDEDWRNRERWDDYKLAVCDMIDRTSTTRVPWTLVEANNKHYARIKVLKTVCDALEARLDADAN